MVPTDDNGGADCTTPFWLDTSTATALFIVYMQHAAYFKLVQINWWVAKYLQTTESLMSLNIVYKHQDNRTFPNYSIFWINENNINEILLHYMWVNINKRLITRKQTPFCDDLISRELYFHTLENFLSLSHTQGMPKLISQQFHRVIAHIKKLAQTVAPDLSKGNFPQNSMVP